MFESPDDEAFYGLGQHQADEFNYKGKNEELFQYNTKVSVPFIVSNKGYGVLMDSYSMMRFGNPDGYSQLSEVFKVYDAEGNKTINKYDRMNNIQTTISYWADGSFRGWVEDVLDENMNPIHYKEFDEQGNLIGEYTLEKDENGNNKWVPVEA